jgi:hypothetical protein
MLARAVEAASCGSQSAVQYFDLALSNFPPKSRRCTARRSSAFEFHFGASPRSDDAVSPGCSVALWEFRQAMKLESGFLSAECCNPWDPASPDDFASENQLKVDPLSQPVKTFSLQNGKPASGAEWPYI